MQTLNTVFGTPAKDSILVPNLAIGLRNNCQGGLWTLGESPVGNELHCSILKFSKYFGDLGNTNNTLWGQIWIVAESGSSSDIPNNCIMVSYIKTRSLSDFNRIIVQLQSKEINPAFGVFCPKYIKHSKGLPDGTTANYFSLEWNWRERTQKDNSLEKLSACLEHSDKLIDYEGTARMQCLDYLSATEIQTLIFKNQKLLEPNF